MPGARQSVRLIVPSVLVPCECAVHRSSSLHAFHTSNSPSSSRRSASFARSLCLLICLNRKDTSSASTSTRYPGSSFLFASPCHVEPSVGYTKTSLSTFPGAVRKAEKKPVCRSGRKLFVMMPCRNFGASGPWREIKRRFVSFAAPDGGGEGGSALVCDENSRVCECFTQPVQV